jgi:drug/metabolite transporter (DMT)-like permease
MSPAAEPAAQARPAGPDHLRGLAGVFAAYLLYAVGDAAAKWLVGSLAVWEILFFRSWLGLMLCLALAWRPSVAAIGQLPRSGRLLGMNLANFAGWAAYYSAAAYLPLPQLYTAYYLSPIIAALLAGPMLGERIQPASWLAAGLGFAGVLVTVAPVQSPLPALLPAGLGIGAAVFWALSAILYRRNVRATGTVELLVTSNISFGALSFVPMVASWRGFGLRQGVLLGAVALAGLAAHYFYIYGVRRVSVAVAGPIGFFSLIWSALLAYLVWGELPQARFLLGGTLILLAGLLVLGGPLRRRRGMA